MNKHEGKNRFNVLISGVMIYWDDWKESCTDEYWKQLEKEMGDTSHMADDLRVEWKGVGQCEEESCTKPNSDHVHASARITKTEEK